MRPAELGYRVSQRLRERRRRRATGATAAIAPGLAAAAASLLAAARRGPTRSVRFFGVSLPYPDPQPLDWSRDYQNGRSAPPRFYADLDYRDEAEVGDSKYTWELNRHQFLVPWALECRRTGDATAAAAVMSVLLDWIARNPRYLGMNWISALEHALRLVNWGLCFDLCRGTAAAERAAPFVLTAVAEKTRFIRETLSLHSSANNHLMGELIGLLAAGVFFPTAAGAADHFRFARGELERQARLQNFGDGVNREQAIYYHHYTAEYILLADSLLQRTGQSLSVDAQQLARRMLTFIHAMTDDSGQPFEIGDRDDGAVTGLNLGSGVAAFESLLWTAATRFGDGAAGAHAARIARRAGRPPLPDQRTRYWYPDATAVIADEPPVKRHFFADGGYFLAADRGYQLLFKSGPFGYPSIAAHSHCDQLGVLLRHDGRDLLTDGGTCVYHTEERWRRYFKGTAAHNTVRVDGRDQAEYAGAFLWASHADGALAAPLLDGDAFEVTGQHAGYRRLPDPVSHERRVAYRPGAGYRVSDDVRGRARHRFELFWNIGSTFRAQRQAAPAGVTAAWTIGDEHATVAHLLVVASGAAVAAQHRGDEQLPAGFESRSYLEKTPCDQLVVSAEQAAWHCVTYVVAGNGPLPDFPSLERRWRE